MKLPEQRLFVSFNVSGKQEQLLIVLDPDKSNVTTPGQLHTSSSPEGPLPDGWETASVIIGNRGRYIHRCTVSLRLKEFGIRCRRPYHGPVLTRRHRQLRVDFVQNHQQRVSWHDVVFSDKSQFKLYHNDGRVRVYRRNGDLFVCLFGA